MYVCSELKLPFACCLHICVTNILIFICQSAFNSNGRRISSPTSFWNSYIKLRHSFAEIISSLSAPLFSFKLVILLITKSLIEIIVFHVWINVKFLPKICITYTNSQNFKVISSIGFPCKSRRIPFTHIVLSKFTLCLSMLSLTGKHKWL